ncbi:hypothetical protein, variant 13 [Aphanomyces invadans]|uniref:Deacetylase sirtuin-type domain-containing protein n=1 Tax=Aphanomyces invadans TaxID=157072 RepID=A0A024TEW2_9STRA|nr:hypothetical protein, variant 11 [Aphanomyces invadans]XP_008878848.1 hypothetical protein, variant 12 [Aphanomyces invadans]XP_008878849.1 hypothetical protein, variant 13 [Aphanomyces invadans]ETV92544.1 hypothetical protein, variant 11 [Aphanomyces invadans]ETV92545.1 hypothetical protein, variant 12 [Aphanomyces invadans]ETV92546.1 hypothetical protein, variant 13 [Aphanomyces invadans]|eukprot:XP_008878847.1 hypothetical protein, variant 11 [Aphanomyces invadans]
MPYVHVQLAPIGENSHRDEIKQMRRSRVMSLRRFHLPCARRLTPDVLSHRCAACIAVTSKEAAPSPLPRLESLDDAVQALKKAKHIVVVVGAGISVSCGIPDFRSKDGIYALANDMGLDLPDAESLFDMDFFRSNPMPFFRFAAAFFKDRSFTPSPTHRFLRRLHDQNQLLRVYSQNVDGLEAAAGVTNVIQCHGTLATSSCMSCDYTVDTSAALQSCQRDGVIPRCPHCIHGILKPNITFFGETLQDATRHALPLDRNKVGLPNVALNDPSERTNADVDVGRLSPRDGNVAASVPRCGHSSLLERGTTNPRQYAVGPTEALAGAPRL